MTEYVCGVVFSDDGTEVLLIAKLRPEWQAGKLNGVGGKIENDELPLDAMRRECKEETGLDIESWINTAIMQFDDCRVYFYRATGPIDKAKSLTDEQVEVVSVSDLPQLNLVRTLDWIIMMSLDEGLVFPVMIKDRSTK